MRLIEHIETPWSPYSVMFSRDGTRLAIGGGSWYGFGGIALYDLATRASNVVRLSDLVQNGGSVSGVAFSADDRHLAATTWRSSQHAGPLCLFEVDGLTLEKRATIARGPGWSPDTGVLLLGTNALVRVHGTQAEELIDIHRWDESLGVDPALAPQHLTCSRLLAVRGNAVTGDDQSRRSSIGGVELNIGAGLVLHALGSGIVSQVAAQNCQRISAIGVTAASGGNDDTVITGGMHGELDLWTWTGEKPYQERRIGMIPEPAVIPEGDFVWATYSPASVVGICTLANGRLVAVTAGGVLATWRDGEPIATWRLPIDGTPRSLAAHPDRAIVAIGIKQGGFGQPHSKVALVELDAEAIEPVWCTPRVLEIAATVDRERMPTDTFDHAVLGVLADALEEAGAPASVHDHLRRHDRRLRCCWVLDALRE